MQSELIIVAIILLLLYIVSQNFLISENFTAENKINDFSYKGCFKEQSSNKAIATSLGTSSNIGDCINKAVTAGYNTVGFQSGDKCYAGTNPQYNKHGIQSNNKCKLSNLEKNTNLVYVKDSESIYPQSITIPSITQAQSQSVSISSTSSCPICPTCTKPVLSEGTEVINKMQLCPICPVQEQQVCPIQEQQVCPDVQVQTCPTCVECETCAECETCVECETCSKPNYTIYFVVIGILLLIVIILLILLAGGSNKKSSQLNQLDTPIDTANILNVNSGTNFDMTTSARPSSSIEMTA